MKLWDDFPGGFAPLFFRAFRMPRQERQLPPALHPELKLTFK
jgi:hypothetical protein